MKCEWNQLIKNEKRPLIVSWTHKLYNGHKFVLLCFEFGRKTRLIMTKNGSFKICTPTLHNKIGTLPNLWKFDNIVNNNDYTNEDMPRNAILLENNPQPIAHYCIKMFLNSQSVKVWKVSNYLWKFPIKHHINEPMS